MPKPWTRAERVRGALPKSSYKHGCRFSPTDAQLVAFLGPLAALRVPEVPFLKCHS